MRVGRFIGLPNQYSRFGRVIDQYGTAYTVDPGQIPEGAEEDDTDYAYKVEIWGNDGGMAYEIIEDD